MENKIPSWDETFFSLAKEISKRSKDPSTKVGAVVVGPNNEVRSVGYNGFPRGVNEKDPKRWERPEKYSWVSHAEENSIYQAAMVGIPLKGCTIYVSWIPCSNCTKAIIQSGISKVVVNDISIPSRWRKDFFVSLHMLEEAGVLICNGTVNWEVSALDVLYKGQKVKLLDKAGTVETITRVRRWLSGGVIAQLASGKEEEFFNIRSLEGRMSIQ